MGYCSMHYRRFRKGADMNAPPRGSVTGCAVDGCERKHEARGYCSTHYQRFMDGLELDAPIVSPNGKQGCSANGCTEPHLAKGYCKSHYSREKNGYAMDKPLRKMRPGEWGEWHKNAKGYIARQRVFNGKKQSQLQHRLVFEEHLGRKLFPHENIHHINGVRDDNRLENLEIWNTSQPSGQRVADKIEWAKEFLRQYGIEVIDSGTSASPIPR